MPVLYNRAQKITSGSPALSKGAVLVACEVAGWVNLIMAFGDVLPYYAASGSYELTGYAIRDYSFTNLPGAAATLTLSNIWSD